MERMSATVDITKPAHIIVPTVEKVRQALLIILNQSKRKKHSIN